MFVIHKGSDNLIRILGFRNGITDAAITGATCSADLFNDDDDVQIGPSLSAFTEDDTNGNYSIQIPDTHAGLVAGQRVRVEATADGGAGLLRLKKFIAVVKELE